MRKILLGGVAALVLSSMSMTASADQLTKAIDSDYAYLDALYKHLHRNPEISLQEVQSAKRVGKELTSLGFKVTSQVGGTGLVAIMKNGDGPTLMIRADMDGLPVPEQTGLPYASKARATDDSGNDVPAMHACGHDVHMTVLVGTARRLAAMKDAWSGTLIMIGQPAEERGLGAHAMLEDGLFTRFPIPAYNIALHSSATLEAGTVGYSSGWALANVDSIDIKVHGIGGHGAYPHTTKDPVVLAAQIVTALQTVVSREVKPGEPAVITVGSIHAGTKHNIISDEAKMQLTVRSYSDETRKLLHDGIKRIAINAGRMAGMPEDKLPEVTFPEKIYTPSTWNDPELAARFGRVVEASGRTKVVHNLPPVMGGEDFSRFGRTDEKIPSLIYWLGTVSAEKIKAAKSGGAALPSLHSPFFAPQPEPTLKGGVAAMTTIAMDILGSKK